MKKIRYLPFGYTIRNGHTVIEQQEADIVRNIFKAYIQGASLKEIAEDLTTNHNHRPCRWFAQAPLGPITSRAYRLIEFSFCCMMRPTAIEIAVCRILLFVTLDYLPF